MKSAEMIELRTDFLISIQTIQFWYENVNSVDIDNINIVMNINFRLYFWILKKNIILIDYKGLWFKNLIQILLIKLLYYNIVKFNIIK